MTWSEREADEENPFRHAGRPGGDWRGVRPTLDNPMSWSMPVGRVAGIVVRVHAIFLLFVLVEVLRAMYAAGEAGQGAVLDLGPMLILLLCLAWTVLLHEFGHCIACRMVGGRADEILMWPLGGLAACEPPGRWSAHLWTAIGGPAVNVALLALLVPLLGTVTGRWLGVAIPSPLDLSGIVHVQDSWWHLSLYLFAWTNLVLLLFNLLPMFPLDGGRILQAAFWPRLGYADSMRIAVRSGYVGAIVLGVLGLVIDETMLVLVAVFGGITCWTTFRQLEYTEQVLGMHGIGSAGFGGVGDDAEDEDEPPTRDEARRAKEAAQAAAEAEELDRVLRKISATGLESLTPKERKLLDRATERRRREG